MSGTAIAIKAPNNSRGRHRDTARVRPAAIGAPNEANTTTEF